jgi:CubicO group peptidase (beta-lactamase class C family)
VPNDHSPALDPERLEHAFDHVAGQVRDGRASYAALAVGRRDGLVRAAAWSRDGSTSAPRSSIASLTKPMTATAVLQLVEEGRLVLTEPVATYLPTFRPAPPPDAGGNSGALEAITPWHILTHTAGVADAPASFFAARSEPPDRNALLERVSTDALRFRPGSAYAYASDSFYVLGALVEHASGQPFQAFLRDRVLAPLGMNATTFDPFEPGPPPLPLEGSFGPQDAPRAAVLEYFISLAMPGGGLWSVPEDVVRFGRAMLHGGTLDGTRILGRPFVDLMTRLHTGNVRDFDGAPQPNYGLGWGLPGLGRGLPASASASGHSGATGSVLVVDPAWDLVIVYLRNEWGASTTATDEAVQRVYAALD